MNSLCLMIKWLLRLAAGYIATSRPRSGVGELHYEVAA